jgi:hypothetical protein
VQAAFDPRAMTEEQLLDMIRTADLAVSWGCGLGFTVSTEDQHVAIVMHPADAEAIIAPPVSFPHPDWRATVLVGKNLLANHCDDVVEGWEPVPVVAGQWELAAGTLLFTPPADGPCSGGPIEATLIGASIAMADGLLEIPDLSMVNDAYGCFAG